MSQIFHHWKNYFMNAGQGDILRWSVRIDSKGWLSVVPDVLV